MIWLMARRNGLRQGSQWHRRTESYMELLYNIGRGSRWNSNAKSHEGGIHVQRLEEIKNLPSEQEANRSETAKWFSNKMDRLQGAMFNAGRTLNDVTGYSAIEGLKKAIEDQERVVKQCRKDVRHTKDKYAETVNQRSASQREVNELLQRKHMWSPQDLERFTNLYRSDHENEHAVLQAEREADEAERLLEEAQVEITKMISARYREEQVWSDKIRRASTWGTWGLMGLNVVLFLLVQLGLEPWKRKRLVSSFADKVESALDDTAGDHSKRLSLIESELRQLQRDSDDVSLEKDLQVVELTWRSYCKRILDSMEQSSSMEIRPVEIVGTACGAVMTGLVLGSLLAMAFR
jgi:hypothetical protein